MIPTKTDSLVELIFKKLKDYKSKEIFLEKENLKRFIFFLFNEHWIDMKNKMKAVIFKLFSI